jgi:hypothetical protein
VFVGGNAELQAMEADGKLVAAVTSLTPEGGSAGSVDTLPEHLWTPEEYASKHASWASDASISAGEAKVDSQTPSIASSVPQILVTPASFAAQRDGDDADLERIYEAICHPATGVDVGDHRVFMRKWRQTVTGADVVAWLRSAPAAKQLLARKPAASIASDMLDCGMLASLGLDERFKPDGTLYRLQRHVRPSAELFALFPTSSGTELPRMHSNGCCGCCMRRATAHAGLFPWTHCSGCPRPRVPVMLVFLPQLNAPAQLPLSIQHCARKARLQYKLHHTIAPAQAHACLHFVKWGR